MTRAQVAQQIVGSLEFNNDLPSANPAVPQNPPAPVIEGWFIHYLHRPATDSQGIVNALLAGVTIQQAQSAILASDEYFKLTGGNNTAFIQALFLDILNRPVDNQTLQTFLTGLDTPGDNVNRQAVAGAVLASAEYSNDLTNQFYLYFLGRAVTPGEGAGFVAELQGGVTIQTVIEQFVASSEYLSRAAALQSSSVPAPSRAPYHPVVTPELEGPFQSPFASV